MKEEKKSFIENELKALIMRLDSMVLDVRAVPNAAGNDIIYVNIIRKSNDAVIKRIGKKQAVLQTIGEVNHMVNIECDSNIAIVKDVLRAIT